MFGRLNGMFAFALADARTREVWLVRDPMGVKPLYVGTRGETTWWSSELSAARDAGIAAHEIDVDALKLYLTFRFVPSPRSILRDVYKVPPGHFVRLSPIAAGQTPEFIAYRCAIRSTATPVGRGEWSEAMMGSLEAAVSRQLMSDVPVSTLLSGGVDSSLVTQMMCAAGASPTAFGIGFASHGDSSELTAGREAAAALGVPFVATSVDDASYLAEWPTSHRGAGEPIGNSSSLLLGILCRTVQRTHKVVLTGQGADEPLGGYPRHVAERLHSLGRLVPAAGAAFAQRILGGDAGRRLTRVLSTTDRAARYAEIMTVLPADNVDALIAGGAPASELARGAVTRWIPADAEKDSLNALLRVDARMSLADDLLLVADHVSMAASVELRVPFLDLQFIELVDRMPSRYKIGWTANRKWLYRDTALRHLPPRLARSLAGLTHERGKKVGFKTPVDRWFGTSMNGNRAWADRLSSIPGLDVVKARRLYVDSDEPQHVRQRLALYALAQWYR
jgi:asparagine synthase (glutamine-hydrolysing)